MSVDKFFRRIYLYIFVLSLRSLSPRSKFSQFKTLSPQKSLSEVVVAPSRRNTSHAFTIAAAKAQSHGAFRSTSFHSRRPHRRCRKRIIFPAYCPRGQRAMLPRINLSICFLPFRSRWMNNGLRCLVIVRRLPSREKWRPASTTSWSLMKSPRGG